MTPPNPPVHKAECPKCGSTFFQEADYRQYQVYASAVPGGGLQPSDESRQLRICLCGEILPVAHRVRYDEVGKSLQESLQMAQKYRAGRDPDKILAELAHDFITRSEFQALIEQMDKLQALLAQGGKDAEPNPPG